MGSSNHIQRISEVNLEKKSLEVFNQIDNFKKMQALLPNLTDLIEEMHINSVNKIIDETEKIDLADEIKRFEIELIKNALLKTRGCQRNAARLLGIKYTTLNTKIKRYGIDFKNLSMEIFN